MSDGKVGGFLLAAVFMSAHLAVAAPVRHMPDEIESVGGHALGFDNAGTAAVSGQASVRTNPAMLSFEKQYRMSAAYHWPSSGRDFYQLGVVDSKTSPIAAGFLYTSSEEKYRTPSLVELPEQRQMAHEDSPIKRRMALGLSQPFDKISLGLSAQFVEFYDESSRVQKASTFGLGVAGLLTSVLRFGASVENLANKKSKDVSPQVYRLGLALSVFDGDLTAHLDAKQRERVRYEIPFIQESDSEKNTDFLDKPLKVYTASFSVRFQDLLRLMLAYSLDDEKAPRSSVAGGLALVNKAFTLSYLLRKPDLNVDQTHQAINFSFGLSI